MRVPYQWLQEYLDTDMSVADLSCCLTMSGLEVEKIEQWTAQDGGAEDQVLITTVTPNRGDLLSMVGVARHAAAVINSAFNPPAASCPETEEPVVDPVKAQLGPLTVEIADPIGCPRYSALLIEGITVKPSPDWLRHRMEAAGIRSINNVVDCTNYVCWELGQPMHAFDFQLIKDGHIIVRKAEENERFLLLDDTWPTLGPEDVVIADPMGAVALAGLMGGADTQMRENSATVLLESAHFDPPTIRQTSLRLGVSTEASYRFERRVDPNLTLPALARAAELILATAGGEITQAALDVCTTDFVPQTVPLRPQRCNSLLGTDIEAQTMAEYLHRLGFEVAKEEKQLLVTVPTFRAEVEREVDLIEEIAIVHGYDNIPLTLPGHLTGSGRLTRSQRLRARVGELLRAGGLNENLSFSMMEPDTLDRLCWPQDCAERDQLRLANPLSQQQCLMRTTLLPALLEACRHNARQRVADVALYEIGTAFLPDPDHALPREEQRVAGIMMGSPLTAQWNLQPEQASVDFYYLKSLLEQLLQHLNVTDIDFSRYEHPTFQPGRCAALVSDQRNIGVIGQIAENVQEAYDLPTTACAFEVNLDVIMDKASLHPGYRPVPRYPAVLRDVAVIVPDTDEFSAARLAAQIKAAGGENLDSVEPFDSYADLQYLGAGRRSVAFNLIFRRPDRTLTDDEIETAVVQIHTRLEEMGGEVRKQ